MCKSRNCLILFVAAAIVLGAGGLTAGAKEVILDKDPNLAGWWKFDETTGATAADSSKHARKGTLMEELTFDKNSSAGRVGKALRFEGNNKCVEIKDYKGVCGTGPRTVAAWIKAKRSQGEIVLWGADDFGQQFRFGYIRGRIGLTPKGGYYYMNPPTHDDKWHHVALVVGEAELPNLHDDITLYLDGEVAEVHDIGLLDLWPVETGKQMDVRIGRGFDGLIDDLRIYSRALSEDEVGAIFRLKSDKPLEKRQAGR